MSKECVECGKRAWHRIVRGGREEVVCREHLPKEIFFSPFLGQQERLFAENARWVLGGGAAGPGKTFCGARLWLKQYHWEQERWRRKEIQQSRGWSLFLRRTVPQLIQVVEDFKRYKDRVGPNRWYDRDHLCVYQNGYHVQFGGCEDDDDYLKFYGLDLTLLVLDEATQFTETQITELDARLRSSDLVLDAQVQMYLLTNPVGGVTKTYLKRRFVDAGPPEVPVEVEIVLGDGRHLVERQIYIPCRLSDNPALMESGRYEANLRTKSAAMQAALLHGDWNVSEGAWLGGDWDPGIHVCEPFPIPPEWPRFKCGDYGYTSQTAILWLAVDWDGNLVCYRFYACRRKTAGELADAIREIESASLVYVAKSGARMTIVEPEWDKDADCSLVLGPMDASVWASQGESSISRGAVLQERGTGFHRSMKGRASRKQGADLIRSAIRRRSADSTGALKVPGLRFFATCRQRLKMDDGSEIVTGPVITLPSIEADANDPDVWDTTGDDHAIDALGYGLVERFGAAERKDDAEIYDFMEMKREKEMRDTKLAW